MIPIGPLPAGIPFAVVPAGLGFAARSLRFNSDVGSYFRWQPSTDGNLRKWTTSFWVKRPHAGLGSIDWCFLAGTFSTNDTYVYFDAADAIVFGTRTASTIYGFISTTPKFRDPTSWYHVVVVYDCDNATATDRQIIYVNNVRAPVTITNQVPTGRDSWVNSASAFQYLGFNPSSFCRLWFFDFVLVDGQALTPSVFAATNATTGKWEPKSQPTAGLTLGTNGRWYSFDNNASTATIVLDDGTGTRGSGAGSNDATTFGTFTLALDSVRDAPIDYDDGLQGQGNFATLNWLDANTIATIAGGGCGLGVTGSSTNNGAVVATQAKDSGKWYWETKLVASGIGHTGITVEAQLQAIGTWYTGQGQGGWGYTSSSGNKLNNNVSTAYGASWTSANYIGNILDMDARKIWWSKDNVVQASGDPVAGTGEAFSGLSLGAASTIFPMASANAATTVICNFGQQPFQNTTLWATLRAAGYRPLCSLWMPDPVILNPAVAVDVNTRSGTGAVGAVSGKLIPTPNLILIKSRSTANQWNIFDSVRGITKGLLTPTTLSEYTDANTLTAFNADGFSFGTDASARGVNISGQSLVDYMWDANVTAGVAVVGYTGDGAASRNVPHGLGVQPKFVIIKRPDSGTYNMPTWHTGLSASTNVMYFNLPDVEAPSATNFTGAPTAANVTIGNAPAVNASGVSYIMYAFAEVPGFARHVRYVGINIADGALVWCGFRPKLVIIKALNSASNWQIYDSVRSPNNGGILRLQASSPNAEDTAIQIDLLANGIKCKDNNAGTNGAFTYILSAWAESPFKYALAR